jgi:serine/threonine-protein kinase
MSGLEGLLAGRTLGGRYRIEEVIGRGGFAAVYRALDERLGRPAAVKVITLATSDAATREQIRRRFEREARVAASLDHPNVVTVYDVGTDAELQLDFLVMELLRGEDLAHRLARPEPLPLAAAVRIFRDAVRGVAAGHAGGLIHRDVKPANIFLAEHEREERFRVCVLDFGIAQIRHAKDSLTRLTHGPAPISPPYASPEQLQESTQLTPASDVFSLGVIGFELLARHRPFDAEQIRAMGRGVPPPDPTRSLPDAPPELEAVLRRALQWEAEHRFPDARAMADALDAVLGSLRAAAPPAAAPPRPVRRRVPVALAAGVPLLLAAGAATWWAVAGGRSESRPAEPRPARVETPAPGQAPRRGPDSLTWSAPPGGTPGPVAATPGGTSGPVAATPGGAPARGGVRTAAPAPGGAGAAPGAVPTRTPAAAPRTPARTAPPVATAPEPRPRPPAPRASAPPRPAPRPPAPATSGGEARSAVALARQADARFARGDVAGAVAGYRRAVAAAPANAYYRNQLGWVLFQSGDLAGAERELRQAIRLDPRRDIAYANLGEVYRVRGDIPEAVAQYRRFLELNTDPRRERIATDKLRSMGASP